MSQLIRKDIFEVHKPSGQISSKLTKSGELHQLTPIQFDTMNYLCYIAREKIHLDYGDDKLKDVFNTKSRDEIFNFLSNHTFTVNLNDLTTFTGTYESSKDMSKLSKSIKELKEITVEMGIFKKHTLMSKDVFSLLRRYKRITNSSTINFQLEPEVLTGWVFDTKPFSKLFLKMQTKLKNTYSKIIYENCKDYENWDDRKNKLYNQDYIDKPLEKWILILGINSKSANYVSTLKRDYLNKAVKEINENTDIFIDDIKGVKKNGVAEMHILFHSQNCKLLDVDPDDIQEMTVEEQMLHNKKEELALKRLEATKKFKSVNNEEAWLKKTISSISDQEIEDLERLRETKELIDAVDISYYNDKLRDMYGDWIHIKNYKLEYTYEQSSGITNVTSTPFETLNVLEELTEE